MGKFASIFEESDSFELFILGDFNAPLGGRFLRERQSVCEDYELILLGCIPFTCIIMYESD